MRPVRGSIVPGSGRGGQSMTPLRRAPPLAEKERLHIRSEGARKRRSLRWRNRGLTPPTFSRGLHNLKAGSSSGASHAPPPMLPVYTDELSFDTDSSLSMDVDPTSEDEEPFVPIGPEDFVRTGSDEEKEVAQLTARSVYFGTSEAKDRRERQRQDRMLLDAGFEEERKWQREQHQGMEQRDIVDLDTGSD